jgi:hypothetical protein
MKIPQARVKALDASLPTLVEDGRECFKSRRTQASGGSNSLAVPLVLGLDAEADADADADTTGAAAGDEGGDAATSSVGVAATSAEGLIVVVILRNGDLDFEGGAHFLF